MRDTALTLDPSSTVTGWAVMDGPGSLIEAGKLFHKPSRAPAKARIVTMARDLVTLLDHHRPGTIVVEFTSGKVNDRRHKGKGAGLPIYGLATGVLWWQCELWADEWHRLALPCRPTILTPTENEWTRRQRKKTRQDRVANTFASYRRDQDKGMDISDAIALGMWYYLDRRIMEAAGDD